MKKILYLVITIIMVLALTVCDEGNGNNTQNNTGTTLKINNDSDYNLADVEYSGVEFGNINSGRDITKSVSSGQRYIYFSLIVNNEKLNCRTAQFIQCIENEANEITIHNNTLIFMRDAEIQNTIKNTMDMLNSPRAIASIFFENNEIMQNGQINLGEVAVEHSYEIEIEIKNSGNSLLEIDIDNITITGNENNAYNILINPSSPIPGGSFSRFTINCTPIRLGDNRATLNIPTNDSNRNPIIVHLLTRGIIIVTYTVTYHANGGIGNMENSIFDYDVVQQLPPNTFTRINSAFKGWATTTDGSVAYNDQQNVINLTEKGETIILYAIWETDYTVVYDSNGGTGTMENSIHTYGTARALEANSFNRTGHTFAGWATSATGSVVYSDQVNVLNITSPGETIILYAQWTANTYTVSYNANSGTGTMVNSTYTYGIAQNLRTNTFTRTNATFAGWAITADSPVIYNDGESVMNLSAEADAIVTLYAVWNRIYTITFESNGGSSVQVQTAVSGNPTSRPSNPSKSNYTFVDWFIDIDLTEPYDFAEPVTDDIILYAKWEFISTVPGANLAAKLAWLEANAISDGDYVIEVNTNETISPTTLLSGTRNNISITLKGIESTRTISLSTNGTMFTIRSGVTIILDDNITLQGRTNNNTSLIWINNGGVLVMNNGSTITGNRSTGTENTRGAILVDGTFTMNGGTISGNSATSSSSTPSGTTFAMGGGVTIRESGYFIMNDGIISGNSASSTGSAAGGGVFVQGIFEMNDGVITGNSVIGSNSRYIGGGVSVYVGGSFTMNDGIISNNSISTTGTGRGGGSGVGVLVVCNI